jgi:hypothetical protein
LQVWEVFGLFCEAVDFTELITVTSFKNTNSNVIILHIIVLDFVVSIVVYSSPLMLRLVVIELLCGHAGFDQQHLAANFV